MRLLSAFAATLLLLAGCGDGDEGGKTVHGPDYHVVVPDDWADVKSEAEDSEELRDMIEEVTGGQLSDPRYEVFLISRNPVDGFAANVNVIRAATDLPKSVTPERFARRGLKEAEAFYDDAPALRPIDPTPVRPGTPVAGDATAHYDATRVFKNRRVRQRQTFIVHEGLGLIVTYSALVKDFQAKLPAADEIFKSWRWD